MKSKVLMLLYVLLFLVTPYAIFAQETNNNNNNENNIPVITPKNEYITISVENRPLQQVLDVVGRQIGINILADPTIEEKVSIELIEPIYWEIALDKICERVKCTWKRTSDNLIDVVKPQLITLNFQDSPLELVIQVIAQKAGANIVISSEVKGSTTISFNNVPWRVALNNIIKTSGYSLVEESNNIIRVISPSKLITQLETRMFQLKYLMPPVPYKGTITSNILKGSSQVISDPISSFSLLNTLKSMLTKNDKGDQIGTLEFLIEKNALIVTDTKPTLDRMAELIRKLDQAPKQVQIDVKYVSTGNSKLAQMGFKYQSLGNPGLGGATTQEIGTSANPYRTRLPWGLGYESPSQQNYFLTSFELAATMRLYTDDNQSQIHQQPRLLALDGQEATIFVGETIRWAKTESESSQSGGVSYSVGEADDSPLNIGFQLFIYPRVIKNTENIMLTIIPQNTLLSTDVSSATLGPGFAEFSVIGGTDAPTTLYLPWTTQTSLVTSMILESNKTGVIGGLVEETVSDVTEKVPFFSALPVFGQLFTYKDVSNKKSYLMIFVTPKIISTSMETQTNFTNTLSNRDKNALSEFNRLGKGIDPDIINKQIIEKKAQEKSEFEKLQNGDFNKDE